jgi:hypothetical protein
LYQELRLDLIQQTLRTLEARITERFSESGLSRVAGELIIVADETGPLLDRIRRPNLYLRAGVGLLIALLVALVIAVLLFGAGRQPDVQGIGGLMQTLESATQNLVFLGIAIWFLISLEGRIKRRLALRMLHRLRSIVHIVDMHQLTKDPEHLLSPGMSTRSSPRREFTRFELGRYLDYCSELLSMSSKLAALHVQYLNDPVVLDAVNDIETLASSLAGKMWQKIVILDSTAGREPAHPIIADSGE